MGAADLQILESVEGGTTVFEAAAQLAALDLVLACVLVKCALRDPKIISSLRLPEPWVLRNRLKRCDLRINLAGRRLNSNCSERLTDLLNEVLRCLRSKHHTCNQDRIALLDCFGEVSRFAHKSPQAFGGKGLELTRSYKVYIYSSVKKSLQMKSTAKGQNGKYSDNRLGLSLSKMPSGPNAYRWNP